MLPPMELPMLSIAVFTIVTSSCTMLKPRLIAAKVKTFDGGDFLGSDLSPSFLNADSKVAGAGSISDGRVKTLESQRPTVQDRLKYGFPGRRFLFACPSENVQLV